jgi:uncharacterized protein (TIGR02147 family)
MFMKKLFEYLDYQEYLRDFYASHKRENPYFSYRYMGRRLSLDPGFLVKVMQGKKHLALNAIDTVSRFCELNEKESDYFEVLMQFGRAKTDRETKRYFEKLNSLRGIKTSIIDQHQYAFYQKWYHTAIWAMLGYYRFAGDYDALAKKLSPPITPKQAKDSIHLLEKLGFIKRNGDKAYAITTEKISTGKKWQSAAIHSFQTETIRLAGESLDRHNKELRDVSTVTVAVSHKDLEEIKLRAQEFRQSILQLQTRAGEMDVVYQVNVQVVPLTVIGAH